MRRPLWVYLCGVLFLWFVVFVVWASMNEQAIQQQSIPGFVLRGTLWQDSTQTDFATSGPTSAMQDSVVLTLLLPSCQIDGAMDSLVVVYRKRKSGG